MNDFRQLPCETWAERISLAAADCLSPDEQQEVRRHVETCPACRERFRELTQLCGILTEARPSEQCPEEALIEQVMSSIASDATTESVAENIRVGKVISLTEKRSRAMKRIVKLTIAATILLALGIFTAWIIIDRGSTNLAFAEVAKAIDNIYCVTYDCVAEVRDSMMNPQGMPPIKSKGMFLAPSHERTELTMGSGKDQSTGIMIMDTHEQKGLVLSPKEKKAIIIDSSSIKLPAGKSSNIFETVRCAVREGSDGIGGEAKSLGEKEIDGRLAVGFQIHSTMADMTIWADPKTARPIRIETGSPTSKVRSVVDNFRYDEELDPSLFSLEPPAGYTVEKIEYKNPTEKDLVSLLRLTAKYNADTFPKAIGIGSKEVFQVIQAETQSATEKHLQSPESQKLRKELLAKYGKDKKGFMKAWMESQQSFNQKLVQEVMLRTQRGIMFYGMLTPAANDPHYVGGGIKLDTPDRPIFWYKPTGADKYRVIYADLSVKEKTPAEVKDFPQKSENYTEAMANLNASFQDAKNVAKMLRLYADHQNGQLPPTLNSSDINSGIQAPIEKEMKAKYDALKEAKKKMSQDPKFMATITNLIMKSGQGLRFLHGLKPENDLHYAGKDVKLDTPDRPILWYKPTGADKYLVIYADLSVKAMTPEEVKKLPEAAKGETL